MYLKELIEIRWTSENNENYCKLDRFGNNIYLHTLFPCLDINQYIDLEKSLNIKLLPELIEFYKYFNGAKLFQIQFQYMELQTVHQPLLTFILITSIKEQNKKNVKTKRIMYSLVD